MPTKQQTITDAVSIVQGTNYPGGFSAQTAWLGIYRALLWYEPVNAAGITTLPHLIDADKLRPRKAPATPNAWQRRALALEQYLAQQLSCPPNQVQQHVDQLLRLPAYQGLQRQNSLGIAFPGVVKFVLEQFGSPAITYQLEVDARTIFPGIAMPGRSTAPMMDILATKAGQPVAIISTKWSVRHDRINDITNECPIYKAAAMRSRTPFAYYVVTNEFDPARLSKMLGDDCIDNLVHIHKYAVITACRLNSRLGGMLDLSDLVAITSDW